MVKEENIKLKNVIENANLSKSQGHLQSHQDIQREQINRIDTGHDPLKIDFWSIFKSKDSVLKGGHKRKLRRSAKGNYGCGNSDSEWGGVWMFKGARENNEG